MSALFSSAADRRETLARIFENQSSDLDNPRLSRSLLLGLFVLALLPPDGSLVGIREITAVTGMSKSTSHRYISTLVVVGLAERDPTTRTYRLAKPTRGSSDG